jgi:hypothetical protein
LSRAQAERAAAAAARNVNAYGQKEEGPSRWQERKEAKRQMYLCSTEKPPILGVKPKASTTSSGGAYSRCQKCFQLGHWTYECKNDHTYISRPSRTQQLKSPKLKKTTRLESCQFLNPDLEMEREEERKLMKEKMEKGKSEKREAKSKRKHVSRSGSDCNSSEAPVFNTTLNHHRPILNILLKEAVQVAAPRTQRTRSGDTKESRRRDGTEQTAHPQRILILMTREAGGRAVGESTGAESDKPDNREGNEEAKYVISFHSAFNKLFPE